MGDNKVSEVQIAAAEQGQAQQFGSRLDASMREMEVIKNNEPLYKLRQNTLVPDESWEYIDPIVVREARRRLQAVNRLRENGLETDLQSIGVLEYKYDKRSDVDEATVSMDMEHQGRNESIGYNRGKVPVPASYVQFAIGARRIANAELENGRAIDEGSIEAGTRQVAEVWEDGLMNGMPATIDGNSVEGLTTHSDRNIGTASNWSSDPDNPYNTIRDMLHDLQDVGYPGPYGAFVDQGQFRYLTDRYGDGSGDTPREEIMDTFGPLGLDFLLPSFQLNQGDVVMFQLTQDVVEMAIAEDIQAIEWQSASGNVRYIRIMGVGVPVVKSTESGESGVVHYSGAHTT